MKAIRWILVAAVLAVFGRVVAHPFIAFDDTEHILRNALVTDPSLSVDQLLTPNVGYIVPVTVNVEAALWALSGGSAWSFHAAGLLLHVICVLLVIALARRLGAGEVAAVCAAAVFALHPIVVEPVAWATGVKDGLAACLALGATLLWLLSRDRPRLGMLAPALAMLAVLAKPNVALLAVPWLFYAYRHAENDDARFGSRRLAWAALALTAAVAIPSGISNYLFVEHGKSAWQWDRPLAVLSTQFEHLLFPLNLAPKYPEAQGLVPVLIGAALLGAMGFALWRWRPRPAAAFMLAAAAVAYLPSSQIIPFPRGAADSYLYLPLAAVAVAAAVVAPARRWVPVVATGVAVILALGTTVQLGNWATPEQLWAPRIASNPNWLDGRVKLADEFVFQGRTEAGVAEFREAFARGRVPTSLRSFGIALGQAGYLDDAECVLVDAVVHDPSDDEALYNYGVTLVLAPERPLAHPAMAPALLKVLASRIEQGRIQWGRELRPALDARIRSSRGSTKPPPWPVGGCRALQARAKPP